MNYSVSSNTLKDRVILVTGAGDGIGKQAAISYAQYGATVILLGRTVRKLEQTYDEIVSLDAPKPAIIPLDLHGATQQDYRDMAQTIRDQFGHLDGVLHNASLLGTLCPFEQIELSTYDDVMQVNVRSQLMMTQALLPLLHQSDDARIVFTSSTVGHQGRAYWGTYAISKFATEGMMQILADELSETNIRVNAINPGGTRTGMRAQAFPAEDPETLKTPFDIMPLYIYLMAPEGQAVHGECIAAQTKD
ncbi:YciK family oxidoreductase [Vibrio mangrovi]|uniref:Putative oxidoreductase YciK n=1 Tax=Vibrio mangrovi TaxID=474394 RepID=A0A1Y6ISP0_9VIBR|nr:YciK family oxidoreductase [Vibrio mangrovi]MDW6001315.1 YciK family oxidoreductase [Vibrio mangrovi]SMS00664.1 putative oxidoreductase YciK [Vibrio mangrovi]